MMGYWKDSKATTEVIKDGWLKTRDLAYMDEEGYIFIEGRSSDMIKSGANRISPKEIEEVIAEIEEVTEVAVIGVPDDILGQVIKAFIIPKDANWNEKRIIQAHCRKNLAIYKIPKFLEFISQLPKTHSGKIKRHLLK